MIEFVTASHDATILQANLLQSPMVSYCGVEVMRGYSNISTAYNANVKRGSIIIYVHHDVYLPPAFEINLKSSLFRLNNIDPNWAVLGVAGVKLVNGQKQNYGHIKDRGRKWGSPAGLPAEVDTLDELLLITRGDFQFDEQFDLHFYGADICMQAKLQGRKCYAINAYCHHNSGLPLGHRSQSFRDCEAKFRAKYIDHLPIVTTCSMLIS